MTTTPANPSPGQPRRDPPPPTQPRGGSGLWIALALIIGVVVVIVAAFVFRPQPPQATSCIQVPELSDTTTRKAALDLAAKLEDIPLDLNLKPKFTEISTTAFQTLSEKQMAFLLLLRAVDCLIKSADTPEKKELVKQLAPELIATARAMWASSHDLKGSGDSLSVKERDILEGSPFGKEILKTLQDAGIK